MGTACGVLHCPSGGEKKSVERGWHPPGMTRLLAKTAHAVKEECKKSAKPPI